MPSLVEWTSNHHIRSGIVLIPEQPLSEKHELEVELGMSVQNKAGIWCKPTARMVLTVDGGTSPAQRAAIIKQGFDEVCENIEKLLEEM